MQQLTDFFHSIVNIGASAILPIIITLLGLLFRMKIGRAIKAGLTVGIGFLGLTLVVNLLTTTLQPAITYYSKIGSGFTIADIGWPAVGAASWMAPFAALVIPCGVLINLLMVRLRWTKTLNVDIWNYMHFLIPGALAYFLFHNFFIGFLVTLLASFVALFIGDLIAPRWQKYFGLEGTTNTTLPYSAWGIPFAWAVNKIIDFIPGLRSLKLNTENINKRLGNFGDPAIIGFVVGVLLALLTRRPVSGMIVMGMGIAGVMVLMPKVVGVLMDGLRPIGKSAQDFMVKHMGENAELNIGMDIALGLGDLCAITTTVLSIPLIILCALIFPHIQLFPVGLLMSVCYISVGASMMSNGNLIRSVISTVLFAVVTMYLEAYVAPGATVFLTHAGVGVKGLGTDLTVSEPWNAFIYWLKTIL